MIRYNNILRPVHDPLCDPCDPPRPPAKNLGGRESRPPTTGLTPMIMNGDIMDVTFPTNFHRHQRATTSFDLCLPFKNSYPVETKLFTDFGRISFYNYH